MKTTRDYTINSVKKALSILKLFDDQKSELTLSEISQLSGIGKSSMLRFLQTMLSEGFIAYDEVTRKYSLGIELYRLGQFKFNALDIRRVAEAPMKRLSNETDLICYLGVRNGDMLVMIDQFLPAHVPAWTQLIVQGGGTRELYSTGIGRLFLAQDSDEEILRYLDRVHLRSFTDSTVTDKLTLLELVREARRDGYSGNVGENESRVCSLCLPIYGMDGAMMAGISVCGLQEDVMPEGEFRADLMRRIRGVAAEISRQMGYSQV